MHRRHAAMIATAEFLYTDTDPKIVSPPLSLSEVTC